MRILCRYLGKDAVALIFDGAVTQPGQWTAGFEPATYGVKVQYQNWSYLKRC